MNGIEQKRSGASLFLMELVIGLLIFAFAAAVCVRIFAGAYRISEDSAALSRAVAIARNAAESVRAGQPEIAERYDAQGNAAAGDAAYRLHLAETESADGLTEVRLTVTDASGQELYTLTTIRGEVAP